MKTEEDARAKLTAEWPRFDAAERASSTSSAGGTPSYVELLVCLGMKLEVEKSSKPSTGQLSTLRWRAGRVGRRRNPPFW